MWDGKEEFLGGVFPHHFLLPIAKSPDLTTGAQAQAFSFCWGPALLSCYRIFGAFFPSCMMLGKVLTDG